MAVTKTLLVFFVVILGVFGETTDPSGDLLPPQPTQSPPNVTTSIAPPTKPTTVSTTSTTASPTTASTTVPPTTPKPTPTPAPITTTAVPPTTPKPTPAPTPADPKVANWTVNFDNSNRSCIFLEAAIQYEILEANLNKSLKINVPLEATGSGSCEGADTQNLKVTWGVNNSLEFDFLKTNTSKFELRDIKTTLNVTSPVAKVYNLVHDESEFSTPSENSYKCARVQTLNLTEENSNITVAYLHISHIQYQAFRNTTEHKFDSALDCEGSITSDIVPIVVGCVLAVLVVMVLIAYLVGRRRCQARGYLSMFAETKREEDYIPMKNLSSCFK